MRSSGARRSAREEKYGGWSANPRGFPGQITVRTHAIVNLKSANGGRKQALESEVDPICGDHESSSADLEETGITLIAPARPTATLGPATQLFVTDHRQYWPQPLVVGNGTLIDLADLIEGRS